MADGHTRIARSYEFTIDDEDLTVYRTSPEGGYAHVEGSIAGFGRSEGINEKGLAISMSSCGIPVRGATASAGWGGKRTAGRIIGLRI